MARLSKASPPRLTKTEYIQRYTINHARSIHKNFLLHHVCIPNEYVWSVVMKSASTSIATAIANKLRIQNRSPHSEEWKPYRVIDHPPKDVFRFAFVRNPYSRLVSYWAMRSDAWKNQLWGGTSFEHFLVNQVYEKQGNDFHVTSQLRTIDDDVTFIGKLENFEQDWNYVRKNTGLGEIEQRNSFKGRYKDWRNFYSAQSRKLVYKAYQEDFETLRYKFEL